MNFNQLTLIFAVTACLARVGSADPPQHVDRNGDSWERIPGIIDSISATSYREQLDELHSLTSIKLGYPQSSVNLNTAVHKQYMLRTKRNWQQWWKSTGEPVSAEKEQHSKVDLPAFNMGWEFFGTKNKQPDDIQPVWIPATWGLYITFTNGDYYGLVREVWIIERGDSQASLTRLRGDYFSGSADNFRRVPWDVTLKELRDFTPEKADQLLRALHYLHQYAPEVNEDVPEDSLQGLYYPYSSVQLRDGRNRVLCNTEGYEFCKSRSKYGDDKSGRTYYFLSTIFADDAKWKLVSGSPSAKLAPYHSFLSMSKPGFASNAADVIKLFGNQGGISELQAMLDWADKELAATDPEIDWEMCTNQFGAKGKDNVIWLNRTAIQETLKEIKAAIVRLEARQNSGEDVAGDLFAACLVRSKELERKVDAMLALERREKEQAILRYPLPLRDLIRIYDHPGNTDWTQISAAIQAIRSKPDPKLFAQLVQAMDEESFKPERLLKTIMVNELELSEVKPWNDEQEAIAMEACIDAFPLAKDEAKESLVEILLLICGEGRIAFKTTSGGRVVEIRMTEDGYRHSQGPSDFPPSVEQTQNKLRRLYKDAKSNRHALGNTNQPSD
ncbi:hypothetical protein AB1L30_11605 [Bremerella sp. JC817]|uniref:hypothetical protein n=1 Tax=Bremerella sp. JC817 TaxID=3231756 RepID=UPI0034579C3F